MRPISALNLPDVTRALVTSPAPEILLLDPASLWIDEKYQRDLSDRSLRLIRKIVADWNWTAYKPPIVSDVDGKLEILDGQHTAIAAVTHGSIGMIPVLVVIAAEREERASAFVRHNRDRVQVTSVQLHTALVAAGDEDAMTIDQVCQRAGITILKNPTPTARFRPGDTMAISTIADVIRRRHAAGARKILEVCVKGGAAPVASGLIKAVEHLLHAKEYAGEIEPERIIHLISAALPKLEQEAARFAAERKVPRWRALASVIFMSRKRR